jgi:hypothetical protein
MGIIIIILVIIIVLILVALAVIKKRKKRAEQELAQPGAITIRPGGLTGPIITGTGAQVPGKAAVPQLPGAHQATAQGQTPTPKVAPTTTPKIPGLPQLPPAKIQEPQPQPKPMISTSAAPPQTTPKPTVATNQPTPKLAITPTPTPKIATTTKPTNGPTVHLPEASTPKQPIPKIQPTPTITTQNQPTPTSKTLPGQTKPVQSKVVNDK